MRPTQRGELVVVLVYALGKLRTAGIERANAVGGAFTNTFLARSKGDGPRLKSRARAPTRPGLGGKGRLDLQPRDTRWVADAFPGAEKSAQELAALAKTVLAEFALLSVSVRARSGWGVFSARCARRGGLPTGRGIWCMGRRRFGRM